MCDLYVHELALWVQYGEGHRKRRFKWWQGPSESSQLMGGQMVAVHTRAFA